MVDEEAAGGGIAEKLAAVPPTRHSVDPKLDACLDLSIRRVLYSSLAGATAAVLFRSRSTRWASVAFGAGVGIGSAYTECSQILDGSLPKWPFKELHATFRMCFRIWTVFELKPLIRGSEIAAEFMQACVQRRRSEERLQGSVF